MISPEQLERLQDPLWRIRNLYKIKKEGEARPLPFTPRDEQLMVINHLLHKPDTPLFIIKSRRIGMSTGIGIAMTDSAIFTKGVTCNLIDQTKPDAHKKSVNIILLALQSLKETAPEIWGNIQWLKNISTERRFRWMGQDDFATRTIYAGENARGGDSSFLWVSEGGPIAASANQAQWLRIHDGAIPSARKGRQVHETTWMGGKTGGMWDLIEPIYSQKPNAKGVIMFFPWHSDPECVDFTEGCDLSGVEDYFKSLESNLGKTFNREQKTWYAITMAEKLKKASGQRMKQEFPSTLEEALETPGANPRFQQDGLDWIQAKQTNNPPLCRYVQLVAQGDEYPTLVPADERTGWLRIWKMPQVGRRYGLPGDFATDKPEMLTDDFDHHALPLLGAPCSVPGSEEITPMECVAAILPDQRTDLDILARRKALMSRFYGDCMVAPETNKHEGYCHMLRQAGCLNIWKRPSDMDNRQKNTAKTYAYGWETTASTKPVIIEALASFIRDKALIVYCPTMLAELRVFQENNKALEGHHDDWVMALAIGCHTVNSFTSYVQRKPPIAYSSGHQPEGYGGYEGYGEGFGSQGIGG